MNDSDEAGPAESARELRVWDLPVRVVHWLLALAIFGCWLTESLGVAWMQWHMRLGYLVLGLAVFRILWGFFGPRYARFSDFLRGPRAVRDYVRSWMAGAPTAHAGHNPLAGWAVMLMLGCILLQATTGLFHSDDILTSGPMRAAVASDLADRLGGLHAANADLLWILIGLHLVALLAHRFVAGERLVAAMWTGRKAGDFPPGRTSIPSSRLWLALGLATAVALAIWAILALAPAPEAAGFDFS